METHALFERVCIAAPAFRAVMAEHLREYGELLGHVLMADLRRFVGKELNRSSSHEEVRQVLLILDEALLAGNKEVKNMIAVSLLEHIATETFYRRLVPLLGANLRAEHLRQEADESAG